MLSLGNVFDWNVIPQHSIQIMKEQIHNSILPLPPLTTTATTALRSFGIRWQSPESFAITANWSFDRWRNKQSNAVRCKNPQPWLGTTTTAAKEWAARSGVTDDESPLRVFDNLIIMHVSNDIELHNVWPLNGVVCCAHLNSWWRRWWPLKVSPKFLHPSPPLLIAPDHLITFTFGPFLGATLPIGGFQMELFFPNITIIHWPIWMCKRSTSRHANVLANSQPPPPPRTVTIRVRISVYLTEWLRWMGKGDPVSHVNENFPCCQSEWMHPKSSSEWIN